MSAGKLRIFELAKELNMSSKDLLALFASLGLKMNNQLSIVEPRIAELLRTQRFDGTRTHSSEKPKEVPEATVRGHSRGNWIERLLLGSSFFAGENRNFTSATLTDEGVRFTGPGADPWLLPYRAITKEAQQITTERSDLYLFYSDQVINLYGIPNDDLPPFIARLNERTKPYRAERDRLASIEAEKERLRIESARREEQQRRAERVRVARLAAEEERLLLEAERLKKEQRLRQEYDSHKQEIDAVISSADSLFNGKRYVRYSDTRAWVSAANAVTPYFELLPVHLLSSTEIDTQQKIQRILADPKKDAEEANQRFIISEMMVWSGLFDSVEKQALTETQRRICVIGEERQRIIAGAGTGKTSSMVAKIAYLICSGAARPEEVFAISYGAAAARELKIRISAAADRIKSEIPAAEPMTSVSASTIHSIAMATLRRAKQHFSVTALAEKANSGAFRAQMQTFIEQAAREPGIGDDVITYLANHSQPEQHPDDFESYEHYLDWFRHCKLMTLRGEIVKSFAEVDIANFFTLNQVAYKYEHLYEFQEDDSAHGVYKPDFYLPDHNIYVEHFGTNKDGSTAPGIDNEKYLASMDWKRRKHSSHGTILVETEQWMRSDGVLIARLSQKLRLLGVELKPRPVEDALALANEHELVTTLATLLCSVVSAFKESRLRLADLKPAKDDPDKIRTTLFFKIFARIFEMYQAMLAERNEIDFTDMIAKATEVLRGTPDLPSIKYILVDEFQDVSPGRGAFLKALVEAANATLCVVGDDWQAIYSFTGCDGALFTDFEAFFGQATTEVLAETFRFNDGILKVSSDFIQMNPSQIRKNLTTERRQNNNAPAVILFEKAADAAPNAALEYLKTHLGVTGDVLFLGRANFVVDEIPIRELQRRHKFKRLRGMTAHGAKGGEADAVVILRASEDVSGFPSLKETDPILKVVLPSVDGFAYAEERRLFYVALTRARDHVVVCFDPNKPSMFVAELARRPDVVTVTLDGLPLMGRKVICRLCNLGTYVYRERARDKKPFYGCTNKECREVASPCGICGGIKDVEGQHWVCARIGCALRVPRCPRCNRGELRTRKGSRGAFLGCSRFTGDDVSSCRFTSDDLTLLDLDPPENSRTSKASVLSGVD